MPATIADQYAAAAAELLARDGVAASRMFGSDALSCRGKTFALLVKGRVVVKLPATRVSELVAAGAGERFDPGHGRLMKEWISLGESAEVRAHVLAAMEYVASRGERIEPPACAHRVLARPFAPARPTWSAPRRPARCR